MKHSQLSLAEEGEQMPLTKRLSLTPRNSLPETAMIETQSNSKVNAVSTTDY